MNNSPVGINTSQIGDHSRVLGATANQQQETPESGNFQGRTLKRVSGDLPGNTLTNKRPFSEKNYDTGLKGWLEQCRANKKSIASLEEKKGTPEFPEELMRVIDDTLKSTNKFEGHTVWFEGSHELSGFEARFSQDGRKLLGSRNSVGSKKAPFVLCLSGDKQNKCAEKPKSIPESGEPVWLIEFSPNGDYCVSRSLEGDIQIFKIDEHGASTAVYCGAAFPPPTHRANTRAQFSPDCKWVILYDTYFGCAALQRDENDQWSEANIGHEEDKLKLSGDGRYLLSYSELGEQLQLTLREYVDGKYGNAEPIDHCGYEVPLRLVVKDHDTVMVEYEYAPPDDDDDEESCDSADTEYGDGTKEKYVLLYSRNKDGKLEMKASAEVEYHFTYSDNGQLYAAAAIGSGGAHIGYCDGKDIWSNHNSFFQTNIVQGKSKPIFSPGQPAIAINSHHKNEIGIYQPVNTEKWKQTLLETKAIITDQKSMAFDFAGHHLITAVNQDSYYSNVQILGENPSGQWTSKGTLTHKGHFACEVMFSPDGRHAFILSKSYPGCYIELQELYPEGTAQPSDMEIDDSGSGSDSFYSADEN